MKDRNGNYFHLTDDPDNYITRSIDLSVGTAVTNPIKSDGLTRIMGECYGVNNAEGMAMTLKMVSEYEDEFDEIMHERAASGRLNATDRRRDQHETDRYWNAIVGNGGQESACGWCKDKWGVSWQITPRVLTEALAAGGDEAKRAFDAMMGMKKIDVAAIKAARRG